MKPLYLSLFLCFFLFNCSKNGGAGGSDSGSAETSAAQDSTATTPAPAPPTNPTTGTTTVGSSGGGSSLPNQAFTFDTNILMINMKVSQEEKVRTAAELIQKVIATDEFRKRVLNHTYKGKKTFVDNGGYTNAQIYQKILDGAETLQRAKNNTMDLEVELYYQASSTIGYTYVSTKRIYMNTKYFNTYKAYQVASNMMHEWLHKVGFGHAFSYSTSRDYSVPYAIGYLILELAGKID